MTAADAYDAGHLPVVRPPQNPCIVSASHRINWYLAEIPGRHKIIERLRMFVIVESVLAENLIHGEQILSQDALPSFPRAGDAARDKRLNCKPYQCYHSECDDRSPLLHGSCPAFIC